MYTAKDKREALDRELTYRRRVFPRLVSTGKMHRQTTDLQIAVFEAIRDGLKPDRRLPAGPPEGVAESGFALVELQGDRQTGIVLLLQLEAINREFIAPGLDGEQVAADSFQGQIGRPTIVA